LGKLACNSVIVIQRPGATERANWPVLSRFVLPQVGAALAALFAAGAVAAAGGVVLAQPTKTVAVRQTRALAARLRVIMFVSF
jgi:hypothetical protein